MAESRKPAFFQKGKKINMFQKSRENFRKQLGGVIFCYKKMKKETRTGIVRFDLVTSC